MLVELKHGVPETFRSESLLSVIVLASLGPVGGAELEEEEVEDAVHRAAGPELVEECRKLGACPTGQAVMTGAYRLPARHLIHAVGPVWNGGDRGEAELLAGCYQRSLELADRAGARTIAFPLISAGMNRFPLNLAARVAVAALCEHADAHELPELIILCTFDATATAAVRLALEAVVRDQAPHVGSIHAEVQCPYCGEPTEVTPDELGGSSVEDCTVCCRAIDVTAAVDQDGVTSVEVRRQDD